MTVHRLLNGGAATCRASSRRMRVGEARRLLAVTPRAAERAAARRDATGTRLRLRALAATGYPATDLAARAGVAPSTIRDLLSGHTRTVTPVLHGAVATLYDDLWDQPPPANTGAQRRATTAARHRAAENGWPPPMGLDDDRIDDPGYRPRSHWRPTAAACAARPKQPEPWAACGRGRGESRRTRPADAET
jgi:hypothetical protein